MYEGNPVVLESQFRSLRFRVTAAPRVISYLGYEMVLSSLDLDMDANYRKA